MFNKVSNWLDNIFNQDIPEDVVAFCFNLYDDGNCNWSMELVGTERFDKDDMDWPCDEITDFGTREGLLVWYKEVQWEEVLEEIISVLKKYLEKGKYAEVLKYRDGVGVGFVDGDVEIVYTNK